MKGLYWYRNGWFTLYENGQIEKPDKYTSDGKSWEFVGLVEKKPFGKVGHLIPRDEVFSNYGYYNSNLRYKNGKYRYYVVDMDHGTRRTWMQ